MRKHLIREAAHVVTPADQPWLDVEPLAQVEITSEDAAHPIESALQHPGYQWRCGPGLAGRMVSDSDVRRQPVCNGPVDWRLLRCVIAALNTTS
jgi:hypothetical protein